MAGLLDILSGNPGQAQAGGSGVRDFLSRLAPAIAMIDPRNQQLGAALMQQNVMRDKERKQTQAGNETMKWLIGQGMGEGEASYLVSDPDALRAWYREVQTGNKPEWKIGKVNTADGEVDAMIDQRTGNWNPLKGAAPRTDSARDKFGLNPQYGVDEQGNPVLLQVGSGGAAVKTQMPDGVTLSKEPIKLDAGTHFVLLDPITRQPVGQIPKDLAGAEREKAAGKALGDDTATFESLSAKMPGLEKVVGDLDVLADKATYTTAGQLTDAARREAGMEPREAAIARAEYIAKVDNQILPLLRDTFGAQFTQREGETLRETLGDPNKSPKEKQAVLRAFIEQKRRDIEALGQRIGRNSGAPSIGTVEDGYRFKGGNPADQSSWEPVN